MKLRCHYCIDYRALVHDKASPIAREKQFKCHVETKKKRDSLQQPRGGLLTRLIQPRHRIWEVVVALWNTYTQKIKSFQVAPS